MFALAASLLLGSSDLSPSSLAANVSSDESQFLFSLRWPRSIGAILAGSALGVAGLLLQSLTRNRLAEPGLLGVNAGACLSVVLAIELFAIDSAMAYLLAALLGALVGNVAVVLLAQSGRARRDSPLRLILAGVALGATFHGLSSCILLAHADGYDQYRFWLLGSLAGVSAASVLTVTPIVFLGLFLALALARPLAALQLGTQQAQMLGYKPWRVTLGLVASSSVLTASAVALAGPIAFIGLLAPLLAPRVAHWLTGGVANLSQQILLCALLGALLLLFADLAARLLAAPFETPLSVLCALIGAPAMLYLARQNGRYTA